VIRSACRLARCPSIAARTRLFELGEIGVGECVAHALGAATDVDVAQATVADVTEQRFDRDAEPIGGFLGIGQH
jgi:hypothetical protein